MFVVTAHKALHKPLYKGYEECLGFRDQTYLVNSHGRPKSLVEILGIIIRVPDFIMLDIAASEARRELQWVSYTVCAGTTYHK